MLNSTPLKVFFAVFLTIVVVGLLGFGFITNSQLNDTKTELASTQTELTTTQANLAGAQTSLANTETQLSATQSDLASSEAKLGVTRTELETASQALDEKSSQLALVQADYLASKQALATEKGLSVELQNTLADLRANYASLTTGYGYVMKDPTYQEAKSFLAADITDSFTYITDDFVCHDFAAQVASNAIGQKIRCAYVLIDFTLPPGHAIIAFNTTDKGLVYFEPQSDEEVQLRIGYSYWLSVIPKPGYYYEKPDYDDTVTEIFALW
jgi:hypothetical protein